MGVPFRKIMDAAEIIESEAEYICGQSIEDIDFPQTKEKLERAHALLEGILIALWQYRQEREREAEL